MHTVSVRNPKLFTLFDQVYLRHVIAAMHEGSAPAEVWGDDPESPTSAFIWDQGSCLYFGGDAHNTSFNQQLHNYLKEQVLPAARQHQRYALKICRRSDDWDTPLESFFGSMECYQSMRVLYSLCPADVSADAIQSGPLPEGFVLAQIDRTLLDDRARPGVDALVSEIESCWYSLDDFLRAGFGYCVTRETGEVAGWCTGEYVSEGMCGIGIETLEAYQQRGLAMATATAFVRHGLARHWKLHWDSWLRNTPSVRVAEKVGFQKEAEYLAWLVIV